MATIIFIIIARRSRGIYFYPLSMNFLRIITHAWKAGEYKQIGGKNDE